MFRRTRLHLVGWNALVLAVILVLVGGSVYLIARRELLAQVDSDLQTRNQNLRDNRHPDDGIPSGGPSGYSGNFFSIVYAPDGGIVSNPQNVTLALDSDEVRTPRFQTVTINGQPARIYITSQPGPNNQTFISVVGESLQPVQQALRRLLVGLLAGGAGGLLLAFAGAWFLAGRALVPIEFAFRRQQEFVADASHELRTPLTVLHATADLLDQHRDEPLSANSQLWEDFRQEVGRLERLATDLLMLARADLGQIDLAVAPVDLALLAAEVARRTAPLAESRGVQLAFEEPNQPIETEVDPDRLQQVLLVLLDNALKHTPAHGRVTVSVQRHGNDALLTVRDTGEGISPEHLPRLFDRFYRVDRARSRQQESAGLGLPIARSIVEAHGGQLTLTSTLGVGTTATIRLPILHNAPSLGGKLGRFAERVSHGQGQGQGQGQEHHPARKAG